MKTVNRIIIIYIVSLFLATCSSSGSSSSGSGGSGGNQDDSDCVSRTFDKVYVNECNFDINVMIFEANARSFFIQANSAVTRTSSKKKFGACRTPLFPALNDSYSGFSCH